MPDEDVRKAVEALKTWWESEGWNLLNVDHPLPYEQIVAVVIKALPVGGDDG